MTDDEFDFSYSPKTFPFHPDCYEWPQVTGPDGTALNIHCIRDNARHDFILMGFIDVDRETQISAVIFMAQKFGGDAEVIAFKGVGLDDGMMNALTANIRRANEDLDMTDLGGRVGMLHVVWPTRFQHKVLREAEDMCRHGDFHETSLAYRLHASVEEIHHHLEVLCDLGLMEAAQ